jgi:hypothetical protein
MMSPSQVNSALLLCRPSRLSFLVRLTATPARTSRPLIGSEFLDANVVDMLQAPNADKLLRDLAILVSERGFCVFRKQSNLSIADEKLLCHKLGQLTTRPYTSGLYIHPVNQMENADGSLDPEVMSPSRNNKKKLYIRKGGYSKGSERNQSRANG